MSASKVVSKAIIFTAQAQQHHTQVKVRNVMKWVNSGYEVKVQITGTGDRQKLMDSIYKELEGNIKSIAKIQQKVIKPEMIKFTIKPNIEKGADRTLENSHQNTDQIL